MIEKIGGRKFVYAILAVIVGLVFAILKIVSGEQILNFIEIIGGTYVIGNVVEAATGK